MKKLWHWLTFPHRLNCMLHNAMDLAAFYEDAYFQTKHQLAARTAQLEDARRHLDALEHRAKQSYRRDK